MAGYSEEIDVVKNAIRGASKLYYGVKYDTDVKDNELGIYDVVTQNDIIAEDHIIKVIKSAFPNDTFLCEEKDNNSLSDGRTWIIDPIDGTINYCRNIPLYGTQVALAVNKKPVVSAMFIPSTNEMYVAEVGKGAFLNDVPIHVSKTIGMHTSILSIGDYSRGSIKFRKDQHALMGILYEKIGRIKMIGSSCYDFVMFSSGRVDYHVRFIRNPWDFMPGLLLSDEAGGVYDKELLEKYSLYVAANSSQALEDICRIIRSEMIW